MASELKQALLDKFPVLGPEEDEPLWEWLADKHRLTLDRQGVEETARIAGQNDVEKYLDRKSSFLRELSTRGLDMDRGADRQQALKLWWEYGYSILDGVQGIPNAAEEARRDIESYLFGRVSSTGAVDGEVLAARFKERDVESAVKLDDKQREFVRAYSEFICKAIQLDYRVLAFRRDVLGDLQRTVSHDEATALIRSPAVQCLPINFFKESGIPIVGHTARFMPVVDAPKNLLVEPPAIFVDASESNVRPMSFRWIAPNGVLEKHPVADSSVLARLQELAGYIAKHHPITEELAAHLVLCGGTVQVAPLSVRVTDVVNAKLGAYSYDHSTVALTVPSWVRPEQVQQAYAKARAQVRAKNSYRSRSNRNVAIFRFVLEQADPILPMDLAPGTQGAFDFPPWAKLKDEWNKKLPGGNRWRFDQPGDTAAKMFRDAFAHGYKAITGKKYYRPRPLTTREDIQRELEDLKQRLANSFNRPGARFVEVTDEEMG